MTIGRPRRRTRELPFPESRQLVSATPGAQFTAFFSARWRTHRPEDPSRISTARRELAATAQAISIRWQVDEPAAAADEINSVLRDPRNHPEGLYRDLTAFVVLTAEPQAREHSARLRADRVRLERLRFLQTNLFTQPALLLIDYIDRYPERVTDVRITDFERLAREAQTGNAWWRPLQEAWDKVLADLEPELQRPYVMDQLLEVLARLAPDQAAEVRTAREHQTLTNGTMPPLDRAVGEPDERS